MGPCRGREHTRGASRRVKSRASCLRRQRRSPRREGAAGSVPPTQRVASVRWARVEEARRECGSPLPRSQSTVALRSKAGRRRVATRRERCRGGAGEGSELRASGAGGGVGRAAQAAGGADPEHPVSGSGRGPGSRRARLRRDFQRHARATGGGCSGGGALSDRPLGDFVALGRDSSL